MLYHHDTRPYEAVAADAAARARAKLEALIDQPRSRAARVIETVQSQQPADRLVRAGAVRFAATDGLVLDIDGHQDTLHTHALNQAASRVSLPRTYVRLLQDPEHQPWGTKLLSSNLNTLYSSSTTPDSRFLLRSVNGEVRGFLSDRFRRLDSRPVVDSFARACHAIGALPVEGYITDTKMALKAILPKVYEPVRHEVMAFGAVLENSDFGNGALSIRTFCLRLWCTNYAIADLGIREVHLGARLAEDIEWSQTTYDLDTKRIASAVSDVVRGQLSPARVDTFQAAICAAAEDKIDPRQVGALLRKTLNKGEVAQVTEAFNSPDVEMMPPGNTTWRLSNAVSWVAGQTTDEERKLDLMKAAGALLPKAA